WDSRGIWDSMVLSYPRVMAAAVWPVLARPGQETIGLTEWLLEHHRESLVVPLQAIAMLGVYAAAWAALARRQRALPWMALARVRSGRRQASAHRPAAQRSRRRGHRHHGAVAVRTPSAAAADDGDSERHAAHRGGNSARMAGDSHRGAFIRVVDRVQRAAAGVFGDRVAA